jgi:flagellar operon protein
VSTGFANPALAPLGPVIPASVATPPAAPATLPAGTLGGPSFANVLAARSTGAQAPIFSKHALDRVQRRGIQLSQPTLARLAGGVSRAAGKGSRDAVVFVDSTAFVVSVPNNTVITAVNSEHMREHVFTNIDSAVFA